MKLSRIIHGGSAWFLVAVLGLACTTQTPSTEPAGQASPAARSDVRLPESIPTVPPAATTISAAASPPAPAASPRAAGSPAAPVPTVASATTRTEPAGRVVYAFDTSIGTAWLDPQENTASLSAYAFQYALHDALIRPMPGNVFSPNLAESYEISDDFRTATFVLRPGITFHNGAPVTPEDVKFSFENYRGTKATVFQERTDRVEIVDNRTVRFHFKEPFLDFLILYGTPASGAGWIVPKAYYEQVGPDGFKQNPIGAGPYKFVQQTAGSEIELEAFTDYWRKTPSVKTLVFKGVPEASTRVAMLQTGEADFINVIPGQLLPTVEQDPNLTVAPVRSTNFWLEFPGYENADNPFHDKRVREAVDLALDRNLLNEAEQGGYAAVVSTWIPENWPGAITGPTPEYNLERAKQLMAEAGYPEGFEVESFVPWPPYISLGERVVTQLREIGIRPRAFDQMERVALLERLAAGPGAVAGIVMLASATPGDAAVRIRDWASCDGSFSRTCDPNIDEPLQQYESSTDPQERDRLIKQIQQYMLDNRIIVSIFRNAFIVGQGPRIANNWEEILGATPQYVYVAPYEDVRLKE